jgi:endonuclease/exonuclease/phosphatase family metal-dependent hydrolase
LSDAASLIDCGVRTAALVLALCLMSDGLRAETSPSARRGRLHLATYNVAGLPEGVSLVHPVATLPRVGKLLNAYDLALVQEDFAYPELLRKNLHLPYRSAPFVRGEALHFGDGLSQFGRLPFGETTRVPWSSCHGVVDSYFDCLTPKGLAFIRVEVSPGLFVDVYDVHLDAGAAAGDRAARAVQLAQLMGAIRERSGDRAVVVAGDFNLTESERPSLLALGASVGLVDVCAQLSCPEPWRLDRVLTRSSRKLSLQPRNWRTDRSFRDAKGQPLSDHLLVAVDLDWSTRD